MITNNSAHDENASFLSEAAKVFTSSLDYERILRDIANLVVPKLADWCSIDLLEDGVPRTLVAAHWDPAKQALAQEWQAKWPLDWNSRTGSSEVMKTGQSEIYTIVTEEMLRRRAVSVEHLNALMQFQIRSIMVVPLKSRYEVYGAVTFVSAESGHQYTETDLKLAGELGCSAGAAIENALLYKRANQAQERAEKSERLLRVTTDRVVENEGRFRRLVEAVPHLTWTSPPNGEIDYFNGRWVEYTGLEPRDHFDFWKAIIDPDHLEEVVGAWKDCVAENKIFESEFLVRDFTGRYQWHLARAVPSKDISGNIIRWFGTWTNIDAQKRQEDRLLKLQEITAALSRAVAPHHVADCVIRNQDVFLSATSISVMILSDDHSCLKILRSAGAFSEFAEENKNVVVLNRLLPFCEVVRNQKPLFFESIQEMLQHYPESEFDIENLGCQALAVIPLIFQGLNLGLVTIGFSTKKVFSGEDKNFLIGAGQQCAQALERSRLFESELNARHRAEEAQYRLTFLADASTQLAETLDKKKITSKIVNFTVPAFADGAIIALANESGGLEYVSSAHTDRDKDVILREIFKTENFNLNSDAPLTQVLKQGKPLFIANNNDNIFRSLALSMNPAQLEQVKDIGIRSLIVSRLGLRDQTSGLLIFFTSTSSRLFSRDDLNMAEELARRTGLALENSRLYDEAQKAVNIRDEFLSIASHELKTPLTSIKLQLQIMQRMREQNRTEAVLEKRIGRALEVFDSQSDRLTKLVDSLLDISKIQAGRLSVELEKVNLSELVKQVVDRFSTQLSVARCMVELHLNERIEGYWDRLRLEQVITNLITNAIKYGAGHPIQVRTFSRNNQAYLAVQDSGIGIAPADQQRIFDRFERAVADRTTWGLGLGLYISRQIVESHQGRIYLQSEKGRGSTFTVELPLHTIRSAHNSPQPQSPRMH